MIKKCTFFVLACMATSMSSLYAASEKPQHPVVPAILTAVGIKCMRVPGIKQIVALPFGIACTVYGVNQLRKHHDVAHVVNLATKKINETVTVPEAMKLLKHCKDKVKSLCSTTRS